MQPFPKPDVGPSSHYNLPNLLGPMGLFPSHQQQKKIFYIIPRAFLSYEKRIDINGQYTANVHCDYTAQILYSRTTDFEITLNSSIVVV